jgi:hypothetical protein
MLNKNQIDQICLKSGGSRRCRYLSSDTKEDVYFCLKNTSKKIIIDNQVKEFANYCSKKEKDLNSFDLPMGDNCDGVSFSRKF